MKPGFCILGNRGLYPPVLPKIGDSGNIRIKQVYTLMIPRYVVAASGLSNWLSSRVCRQIGDGAGEEEQSHQI